MAVETANVQVVRTGSIDSCTNESKRRAAGSNLDVMEWSAGGEHLVHGAVIKTKQKNAIRVAVFTWPVGSNDQQPIAVGHPFEFSNSPRPFGLLVDRLGRYVDRPNARMFCVSVDNFGVIEFLRLLLF